MRNITVSVPDDVYTAARVYAARHNTSVSVVVADFLMTLSKLGRRGARVQPEAAIAVHNELLKESPGRVHKEPFNIREVLALTKETVVKF
jgi:plasmid stability protein